MNIFVNGSCRSIGQHETIGAVAAVFLVRSGLADTHIGTLPRNPPPTNQRAEIHAIILALERALQDYHYLHSIPYLVVNIFSDSRYAIGCMTDLIFRWSNNGWLDSWGNGVVNRDLLEIASYLDGRLKEIGYVAYMWLPRGQLSNADAACDRRLDEVENEVAMTASDSSTLWAVAHSHYR
jgi:ribonuclease HI